MRQGLQKSAAFGPPKRDPNVKNMKEGPSSGTEKRLANWALKLLVVCDRKKQTDRLCFRCCPWLLASLPDQQAVYTLAWPFSLVFFGPQNVGPTYR